MPAQLMALTEGPNILLDKPILLFGRSPECDIQIDSRKISRRHCCVAQVNDYLVVRDLGSTNGIRINGVRVSEGRLRSGDEITIGNHRYQVRWDPLEGRLGKATPVQMEPAPARTRETAEEDEDDELLESCDEPVALEEPDGKPRDTVRSPDRKAPQVQTAITEEKPNRPAALEKPNLPPPVPLPENLPLSPLNDPARSRRGKHRPRS
jgi:pSer/pThr/pTyr-binding forkhead associated (FHA) protein